MLAVAGKLLTSLIGLAIIGAAVGLVWYIFWAELVTWYATLGALACAALFGFLGLTLLVTPWRSKTSGPGEGMQG